VTENLSGSTTHKDVHITMSEMGTSSPFPLQRKCSSALETSSGAQQVRILVVEDFPQFREYISAALEERPNLRIIGETADGLEAVQKAVELKPDLILMDIGLPSLNGIDAARRILEVVPKTKIIFLSQESSINVMQVALNVGACGYVVKIKAARELLPAIDAAVSR
jgi:DNA-binding NarL/FixJ family response regulator